MRFTHRYDHHLQGLELRADSEELRAELARVKRPHSR